ncbi:hypothetical protein Tco_1434832 [Tanacetum coccineum]
MTITDTEALLLVLVLCFCSPGKMTHLVAISTLDSANPCVMQGASLYTRRFHGIFGRINIINKFFLSSILLLVVIIVMVVFVVVVVLVVVAVVGVVIVVVVPLVPVFLLVLSVFAMLAACAFKAVATLSATSCRMAAKVMAGVSDVDVLLGGILSTR